LHLTRELLESYEGTRGRREKGEATVSMRERVQRERRRRREGREEEEGVTCLKQCNAQREL